MTQKMCQKKGLDFRESDWQTSSSASVMTGALCFLPILFQEDSQTKDGPVLLSQGWGMYCSYVAALVTTHAHTPSQLKCWSSTPKLVLGLSVCKIHFWKAIICSRDSELNVLHQVADGKMLFLEFMTSNMFQRRSFMSHDEKKGSHFVHLFTLSVGVTGEHSSQRSDSGQAYWTETLLCHLFPWFAFSVQFRHVVVV